MLENKEEKQFEKSHIFRRPSDIILRCSNREFYFSQLTKETTENPATTNAIRKILIEQKMVVLSRMTKREKYFKLTQKGEMIFQELLGINNAMGWKV